jgi:hypothetical protein
MEYGADLAEWVLYNSKWAGWRSVEAVSCQGQGNGKGSGHLCVLRAEAVTTASR